MKKCLETNCGTFAFTLDTDTSNIVDYGEGEESGADNEFPGKPNTCVSRCKRLRFSPARQTVASLLVSKKMVWIKYLTLT